MCTLSQPPAAGRRSASRCQSPKPCSLRPNPLGPLAYCTGPAFESVAPELGRLGVHPDAIARVNASAEFRQDNVRSSAEHLMTAMLKRLDQGLEPSGELVIGSRTASFKTSPASTKAAPIRWLLRLSLVVSPSGGSER